MTAALPTGAWGKIGAAMAVQAQRVNAPQSLPDALNRIEEMQREIDDLRAKLRNVQRTANIQAEPNAQSFAKSVTAARFAAMHGVAASTISRKFHAGKLRGYQNPQTGVILIDADQEFVRERRERKSR